MVVIRLARTGAKKNPFYHVVVTDSRNSRDGRYIERLGYFNPVARGRETRLELNKERIEYWTGKGAQLSERAVKLVKEFTKLEGKPAEANPTVFELKRAQQEASEKSAKEKALAEKAAADAAAKAEAEEKAKAEADAAETAPDEEKADKAE